MRLTKFSWTLHRALAYRIQGIVEMIRWICRLREGQWINNQPTTCLEVLRSSSCCLSRLYKLYVDWNLNMVMMVLLMLYFLQNAMRDSTCGCWKRIYTCSMSAFVYIRNLSNVHDPKPLYCIYISIKSSPIYSYSRIYTVHQPSISMSVEIPITFYSNVGFYASSIDEELTTSDPMWSDIANQCQDCGSFSVSFHYDVDQRGCLLYPRDLSNTKSEKGSYLLLPYSQMKQVSLVK